MARGINTKCTHLEEDEQSVKNYGAISYPIYQTATYAHMGVGRSTGFDYSRLQNPTREQLEWHRCHRISYRYGSDHHDDGALQARRSPDRGF